MSIGFSKLGQHGRLGNQLHQYALLISVSEKTGYDIDLPKDLFNRIHHGQKCLLDNFNLSRANFRDFSPQNIFFELGYRNYDESVFLVPDGTDFQGHFEHQRYASDVRSILLEEFSLKNHIYDACAEKFNNFILKNAGFNKPLVSLHIRRGDLVDAPPEESSWAFSFAPGTPYGDYYSKAIDLLPKDCFIFVFSGGARLGGGDLIQKNKTDLEWCKNNIFKDDRFVFVDDFNDIETLFFMSMVDFNITSYGSTFSWWGSFLNKNSIVFAPERFFPTEKFSSYSSDQFYPSSWKLL